MPCRILLGLSADTLFAATQRVQPALGRPNCLKNRARYEPLTVRLAPVLPVDHPCEF
jgi:hypothetical protein